MRVSDLSVGMLAYFVGTERLYAVLLAPRGELRRFPLLTCAEAFPLVDRLLDVLEQPYAWTPSQRAEVVLDFSQRWGRRLLPPADDLRQFDILVMVPHHFLHGVPLHLVTCAEEPLATSHGVTYCSSATLLDRCAQRNLARHFDPRSWRFPVDDDADQPSGPQIESCLSYGVDVLTGKDAAYREVAETFASHFPTKAVAGSRSEIKNAVDLYRHASTGEPARVDPDAICLVCHGYYDAMSVDRSGLLLAGRRGISDLRRVRVHGETMLRIQDHPFAEIPYRLNPSPPRSAPYGIFDPEVLATSELAVHCDSDAQLIALFGCSTGTGAVTSNDDYVSHAYQWLKAGAASVVANLWEADFSIISDWTQRFAVNWVQHRQPKAIAAREATRALLAERSELTEQAALWGSVSVLGDWL